MECWSAVKILLRMRTKHYALGFQEAREAAAKVCLEPAKGLVYKRRKTINECIEAIRALEPKA